MIHGSQHLNQKPSIPLLLCNKACENKEVTGIIVGLVLLILAISPLMPNVITGAWASRTQFIIGCLGAVVVLVSLFLKCEASQNQKTESKQEEITNYLENRQKSLRAVTGDDELRSKIGEYLGLKTDKEQVKNFLEAYKKGSKSFFENLFGPQECPFPQKFMYQVVHDGKIRIFEVMFYRFRPQMIELFKKDPNFLQTIIETAQNLEGFECVNLLVAQSAGIREQYRSYFNNLAIRLMDTCVSEHGQLDIMESYKAFKKSNPLDEEFQRTQLQQERRFQLLLVLIRERFYFESPKLLEQAIELRNIQLVEYLMRPSYKQLFHLALDWKDLEELLSKPLYELPAEISKNASSLSSQAKSAESPYIHLANAKNAQGNTPLHEAIQRGNFSFAKVLIQRFQANSNIPNKHKVTAYQLLEKVQPRSEEVLVLLRLMRPEIEFRIHHDEPRDVSSKEERVLKD